VKFQKSIEPLSQKKKISFLGKTDLTSVKTALGMGREIFSAASETIPNFFEFRLGKIQIKEF
jgi:hypothetical protein